MNQYDVAIVGCGIAGISLAWHLQGRGKKVIILEKSSRPEGATVRNFGMVWVVGQPNPETEQLALKSREFWQRASGELGFWLKPVGSLHLAYEDLEMAVLREFVSQDPGIHDRRILSPEETLAKCPNVRPENLRGSLFSETECAVDPREVAYAAIPRLQKMGVDILFDSNVGQIENGSIRLTDGSVIHADKTVVTAGPELRQTLPNVYKEAGLKECRLQMLRLKPKQPRPLGIHLCSGLTIGHYKNFAKCPSLPQLKELHKQKWPLQVESGIHVLVAEYPDGRITVGDSHHYGSKGPVYQSEEVYEQLLTAMDEFLPRDQYEVEERWLGAYPTHPTDSYWMKEIDKDIWVLSLFGTGMTLSFGVTELLAKELLKQQ